MSTTITSQRAPSRRQILGWIAPLVSGFSWGLEMRRRDESERAAGRPVDEQALRRIVSEVDARQGRRT